MQETRREFSPWHSFCRKNLRFSVKMHRIIMGFYTHPTKFDTIFAGLKARLRSDLFIETH